jgi:hypothetical protein
MTYQITKEIRIIHEEDGWDYVFTTDEYGTVSVIYSEGLEAFSGTTKAIHIPKDCIQHFIDVLGQLK